MSPTIAQVASAMQEILTTTAAQAGHDSRFVQRPTTAKLDGAILAQTMTLTLLSTPTPSLEQLCQTAAALGTPISPQGLDQRFTAAAATCLQQVLAAALQRVIAAQPVAIPLLQRFPGGVCIQDSTTITLPPTLANQWPGCRSRGTGGRAALKVQVQLDLLHGQLRGELQPGRAAEQTSTLDSHLLSGALRIADLGYWDLERLNVLTTQGQFWLSRMHQQTQLQTADGQWWTLLDLVQANAAATPLDLLVRLGKEAQVPARLLAVAVPQEVADQRRRKLRATARRKGRMVSAVQLALAGWTILVTNVPVTQLTITEALVLARMRWQIELLFKLWKSHGQVDLLRPVHLWRRVCELYGRLLAMVVQHWVLVTSCWAFPDRSLTKAAHTVRHHACGIATALRCPEQLVAVLTNLAACVAAGCRLNRRKTRPNTVQYALDPALYEIA